METGSGADASGCSGLAIGNAASGVMGAGGISVAWDACGAGNTSSAPLLEDGVEKLACRNSNSSSYVSRVRHQPHFQPQYAGKQKIHCWNASPVE